MSGLQIETITKINMKEFDDALFDAIKKLPEYLKYMVEEKGYYGSEDNIFLRVNPDESCSIEANLWPAIKFNNLDEFIQFIEEEEYVL